MRKKINHPKNFLDGFASVLGSIGSVSHYSGMHVPKDGFVQDARNLSGDFRNVASDMRRAIDYTEQKYGTR